jgi:hypothetical protein
LLETPEAEFTVKKKKKVRSWLKGASSKGHLKDSSVSSQTLPLNQDTKFSNGTCSQEIGFLKGVDFDLDVCDLRGTPSDSKAYTTTNNPPLKLRMPVLDKDTPGDQVEIVVTACHINVVTPACMKTILISLLIQCLFLLSCLI